GTGMRTLALGPILLLAARGRGHVASERERDPRIRMAPYSDLERETLVTAKELDNAVEQMQRTAERERAAAESHTTGAPQTPMVPPRKLGDSTRPARIRV